MLYVISGLYEYIYYPINRDSPPIPLLHQESNLVEPSKFPTCIKFLNIL